MNMTELVGALPRTKGTSPPPSRQRCSSGFFAGHIHSSSIVKAKMRCNGMLSKNSKNIRFWKFCDLAREWRRVCEICGLV